MYFLFNEDFLKELKSCFGIFFLCPLSCVRDVFRVCFILHFLRDLSNFYLRSWTLFCTAYLICPGSCGMFSVMKNSLCPPFRYLVPCTLYRTLYLYLVLFPKILWIINSVVDPDLAKKGQININFISTLRVPVGTVPISSIKKYNCFD